MSHQDRTDHPSRHLLTTAPGPDRARNGSGTAGRTDLCRRLPPGTNRPAGNRRPQQLGAPVRQRQTPFDQITKGLARARRRGYSLRQGVSPCWHRRQPALVCQSSARMHPDRIFPASLGFRRNRCWRWRSSVRRRHGRPMTRCTKICFETAFRANPEPTESFATTNLRQNQ